MSNNKFATLPEGPDAPSTLYGFDAGQGAGSELSITGTELTLWIRMKRMPNWEDGWHNLISKCCGGVRPFALRYPNHLDTLQLAINDAQQVGVSFDMPEDQWLDISGVLSGGTASVYVHDTATGNLLATNSAASAENIGSSTSPFLVGGVVFGSDYYYSMGSEVESVAIWDVGLSAADIEALTVPEPGSFALLVIALLGLAGYGWRKRQK
jgi:hypothetical protein